MSWMRKGKLFWFLDGMDLVYFAMEEEGKGYLRSEEFESFKKKICHLKSSNIIMLTV